MALDVTVKIELSKPAGNSYFGHPCVLSIGEAKEYTECSTLEEVVAAGYTVESETYKAVAMMKSQANAPKKVAVCSVATTANLSDLNNKDWRQLVVVGAVENMAEVVTYINTAGRKMLFVNVSDVSKLADLGDSDRVVAFVHSNSLAAAALAGESAGREPGSFTYKNLMLTGIEPMVLTDTEIEEIHEAGGLTYVTKAGDNVTTEGKTVGGEYIDIMDSMDFVISQIEYKVQKVFNTSDKVKFDNTGIAMLESATLDALRESYNNGIIATAEDGTPDYETNFAPRSEVPASDRAERVYKYGKFRFGLAGAIHFAEITGTVEV